MLLHAAAYDQRQELFWDDEFSVQDWIVIHYSGEGDLVAKIMLSEMGKFIASIFLKGSLFGVPLHTNFHESSTTLEKYPLETNYQSFWCV